MKKVTDPGDNISVIFWKHKCNPCVFLMFYRTQKSAWVELQHQTPQWVACCILMLLVIVSKESRWIYILYDLLSCVCLSVVPLKTELNYEILEKGHVRFWVQALKLSASANHRFIVNDKAISSTEVQPQHPYKKYKNVSPRYWGKMMHVFS